MRSKLYLFLLLAFLPAVALAAPGKKLPVEQLRFGKYRIVSVVPTGFRSVRANIEMEVRNDTSDFLLQDVALTVFRKGNPFLEGACGEIRVSKGVSRVSAVGEFELCPDVGLWSALKALRDLDMGEYSGDIQLTVVSEKGKRYAYAQQGVSMASLGQSPEKAVKEVPRKKEEVPQTVDAPGKTEVPRETVRPDSPEKKEKKADPPAKKTRRWRWRFWKKR